MALGVLPGTGGTQRLARLVGKARAIELQQLLFQSDDAQEGLAANLEKRKPEFKGR